MVFYRALCAFRPALGIFFLLCILTACSSSKIIVNGLEEREANEILVLLADKGIAANKVPSAVPAGAGGGGVLLYDISVPESQSIEAMAILNANGLPRRQTQNLLELFQKSGLVPSQMEEKIRYRAGLAEQMASTIRKMPGVVDADVQLSFPEEDPLSPGKKLGKITASIYVKYAGTMDPNVHLDTKIKRFVSGSIDGLSYDDVTVVTDRARNAEVPLNPAAAETPREYVSVWTVIIAKESLTRFRIIFFSMLTMTFLAILVVIWTIWKCLPLVRAAGIRAFLLNMTPFTAAGLEKKEEKKEEEPKEKQEGDENLFDDEEGDSKKNKEVT